MKPYVFLLILAITAATSSPLDASTHTLHVNLSNTITLDSTTLNNKVYSVEARLSWIPRDTYRQTPTTIQFTPTARRDGDEAVFTWNRPRSDSLTIHGASTVNATNAYAPVTTNPSFPDNAPAQLQRYTKSQDIIDITPAIRQKAASIAASENTVYDTALALATWVNENINYSLTTLTEQPSKPASWVLEKRRGVCDELTSLFISMARSLDIPARFVYGEAYSNVNNAWGPHGWAEVYIDEQWVPFDPTYDLYGKLSSTHVKMGTSQDARRPTVTYAATARDTRLSPGKVNVTITSLHATNTTPGVAVTASPRLDAIRLDGSNVIDVHVQNRDDVYKPVQVRLAAPQAIPNKAKTVLVAPGENRTVSWQVTPHNLTPGYVYTFPITARAGGVFATTSFTARRGGASTTLSGDESAATQVLKCSPRRNPVRPGHPVAIDCTVPSCSKCLTTTTRTFTTPGEHTVVVNETVVGKKRLGSTTVSVVGRPNVSISLNSSPSLSPVRSNNVTIVVSSGDVAPQNLTTTITFKGRQHSWHLDALPRREEFTLAINGGVTFTNELSATVTYTDRFNQSYTRTASYTLRGAEDSWRGTALLWMHSLVQWVRTLPANF